MKTRLVVFDLDGTIIDSSADLATAVNAALRRLAPGTPTLPQSRVRTLIGDGARMLVKRSLAVAGITLPLELVLTSFMESYRECLLDTTKLYPGVAEVLTAVSDRTLAILTNKPGDMSRTILEGLGISHRFSRIYGGGDLPARKPDPVGLRRLLSETGITPGEAAMVGDSAIDVRTGRAAGVSTFGVTYGFDPEGLKSDPPHYLLDKLRDLLPLLDR